MSARDVVYCVARCADGRWLLLNRRYKPYGHATTGWVDYDTCCGIRVWLRDRDLRQLDGGQRRYRPGDCQLWLYHHANRPDVNRTMRAAYTKKLKLLGLDDVDVTSEVLDHDASQHDIARHEGNDEHI